jgi:hypothetical protein
MDVNVVATVVFIIITVAALVYIGLYGVRVIGDPVINDLKMLNPNTTKEAWVKEGRFNIRAAIVTGLWILCLIAWLAVIGLN